MAQHRKHHAVLVNHTGLTAVRVALVLRVRSDGDAASANLDIGQLTT